VWGQCILERPHSLVPRFTPTGVGTMITLYVITVHSTVHPHGCGDNEVVVFIGVDVDGSPPRVWGQSCDGSVVAVHPAVHPHGCGDNEEVCDG